MFYQHFKDTLNQNDLGFRQGFIATFVAGLTAGAIAIFYKDYALPVRIFAFGGFLVTLWVSFYVGGILKQMAVYYANAAPKVSANSESLEDAWNNLHQRLKDLFAKAKDADNRLGTEMARLRSALLGLENLYSHPESLLDLARIARDAAAISNGVPTKDLSWKWQKTVRKGERAFMITVTVNDEEKTFCSHPDEKLLPPEKETNLDEAEMQKNIEQEAAI